MLIRCTSIWLYYISCFIVELLWGRSTLSLVHLGCFPTPFLHFLNKHFDSWLIVHLQRQTCRGELNTQLCHVYGFFAKRFLLHLSQGLFPSVPQTTPRLGTCEGDQFSIASFLEKWRIILLRFMRPLQCSHVCGYDSEILCLQFLLDLSVRSFAIIPKQQSLQWGPNSNISG